MMTLVICNLTYVDLYSVVCISNENKQQTDSSVWRALSHRTQIARPEGGRRQKGHSEKERQKLPADYGACGHEKPLGFLMIYRRFFVVEPGFVLSSSRGFLSSSRLLKSCCWVTGNRTGVFGGVGGPTGGGAQLTATPSPPVGWEDGTADDYKENARGSLVGVVVQVQGDMAAGRCSRQVKAVSLRGLTGDTHGILDPALEVALRHPISSSMSKPKVVIVVKVLFILLKGLDGI